MTRVLSLLCFALFVIGFGGAQAHAKPAIAVLGLEVTDASPTAQDTQVAKDLSDGLRARAKTGTGQYQLAPGSDKELIDQKLLNNCDSEAPACMSAIGGQLGADVLMFGKIQKEGKAYQVTLKVLDVGRKNITKSSTDLIPLGEASGAALQGWAKKIYAKLTGESSTGSIVVKLSNAERGTILIDGEAKGNITAGAGQVSGLPEGKYKLTIESDGFRRWDRDVTVTAGGTANIPVELEKNASGGGDTGGGVIGPGPGPTPGPSDTASRGSGVWKAVFVVAVLGAAGGGGLIFKGRSDIASAEEEICRLGGYKDGGPTERGGIMCATQMGNPTDADLQPFNDQGETGKLYTQIGTATAIAAGGFAVYAFYKGFLAKGSSSREKSAARGKRQRRERFIVTPVVSPDGGGATVRFDW